MITKETSGSLDTATSVFRSVFRLTENTSLTSENNEFGEGNMSDAVFIELSRRY